MTFYKRYGAARVVYMMRLYQLAERWMSLCRNLLLVGNKKNRGERVFILFFCLVTPVSKRLVPSFSAS